MTNDRISRDLALERIRHHIQDYPPEVLELPLEQALGLVAAQDLFALHATPPHQRSHVDGYALHSAETASATPDTPVTLRAAGQIRPSTAAPDNHVTGQASGILTGGPLPAGADCVVPVEELELANGTVTLRRPYSAGDHVQAAGSDLKLGSRIARRGDELTPPALASLAVSGSVRTRTYRPPQVLALALGNELDLLGAPPSPGHMPADNLLMVSGLLRMRSVPDTTAAVCHGGLEDIARTLSEAQGRHVVTTGGTGPGERDHIRRASLMAGYKPLFDGLLLTPGKSMFAAAKGNSLLFALPGTPWAVFALMHAVVLPAMCWLRGRTLPVPGPVLARPSVMPPTGQPGWERLIPCTISALGAELQAQPLLDRSRESRLDMLQAQGLLIVSSQAEPGELLPMIPIWESRRGHRPA